MEPEWLSDLRDIWVAEGPGAVLLGLEQICSEEYSKKLEDFTVGAEEVTLYNDVSDGLRLLATLWDAKTKMPVPRAEFKEAN